jgi:hypothetical protein
MLGDQPIDPIKLARSSAAAEPLGAWSVATRISLSTSPSLPWSARSIQASRAFHSGRLPVGQ